MAETEYTPSPAQNVSCVAPGHGIFESRSTPVTAVGTKLEMTDGRLFRYGEFAADTNRALLVSQDISATNQVESDGAMKAASAGAKAVSITLASVTKNQFAGGYLITTDDAGEGYCYRIKSNTATDDPVTGDFVANLYDPIVEAITTATDYAIIGNPWYGLTGATAATDTNVSGVSVLTMDESEANYGWVQTKGVGVVLADGTIALGDQLTLSDGVTGAVQTAAGGGTDIADLVAEQIVGYAMFAPDSGGHCGVWLQIE